ncbi:MAG: SGNH/GDSL hydrolase family protein [Chloroflexi bacterium]|nr:SGNH/GDSL hydrolase family protein [Chloroflexota bacterium]
MIAIGDSFTQGAGDGTGRGYPARVLEQATQERPGSTITNFGQSGWTSDALIRGDRELPGQLERALAEVDSALSQGRGAAVFVWIGGNDLWYLYDRGGDVTVEQEERDAERFAENMDTILTALRDTGAQVIVALLDDPSKRPAVSPSETFGGITPGEFASMSLQVVRYNEIIRQKAEQYGALTVDFYGADIFANPAAMSEDGFHPNQAGYDLIAQKWLEALAPLLRGG